MKKYKIGIIGYGGFGKFLHYWWEKLPNVEIVAIADPHKNFQSEENFVVYRDWKELIQDKNIDIVSIVTPPSLHAEMACAAMKAGKHVLLEKPVAISEEGAREIIETQKQTGSVITVDHMIRYNPIIQNLIKLGQAGTFGKLRHVVVNNYAQDEALPQDHWFWKTEMSGGIFIEHGVHFFDIVNAIGNQEYIEVYGCTDSRNENQRDRMAAMVLYNEGLIASYYHAFSGPGLFEQTTIHLAYDLARIEIEGWMPMKGTVKALVNSQGKVQLESLPGWTITVHGELNTLRDVSRPEGWGSEDLPAENQAVNAGGITYQVDEMLSGNFEIHQTKGEVYGKCVQSILSDIIKKIENKDHQLTITIEDAFESLKTAILASQ
ncbi:Glucose--fructose oxidoreductase [Pedobacter sp. Bi27]|uniref:Gfo/Idh/MocA family protein n=1 Tax=unclassified Pedobacter TaxID=2628915 RepID=UPI001D5314B4|nr:MULTISPECIES: Gfo/Idh/MocA family oxidoreductase [unclassified Pedobacter]CAH0126829.1 Glucose--fructose oxidoreductase [Pedobacter sp. Bi36]CAH0180980.1 Glucose--fructose oxidoreductase [Pedobacter sp. Bi126]CAH0277064.1 Glucose--fructose oxidoreductase [Pedobacter sp. Bi27]